MCVVSFSILIKPKRLSADDINKVDLLKDNDDDSGYYKDIHNLQPGVLNIFKPPPDPK